MDAYSHAHNIGLKLEPEVDKIINWFQVELKSVQLDSALKTRALEALYQELLEALVPLMIEKTIGMVNQYLASNDNADSLTMARQTLLELEQLVISHKSWEVKATETLQILQKNQGPQTVGTQVGSWHDTYQTRSIFH